MSDSTNADRAGIRTPSAPSGAHGRHFTRAIGGCLSPASVRRSTVCSSFLDLSLEFDRRVAIIAAA